MPHLKRTAIHVAVVAAVAGAVGWLGLAWGWAVAWGLLVWAMLASGWAMRVGLAVSALCLAYFFRGMDFAELGRAMAGIRPFWLLPAVLCGLALYLVKTYRWRILLRPVKELGFWRLFRASFMGFMVNCLLPARIGEFVRAGVVAMRGDVRVAPVFATILVERVFDLFGVVFYFWACAFLLWPQLTRPEISGMMGFVWLVGGAFTVAVLSGAAVLTLLKAYPQRVLSASERVVRLGCRVCLGAARCAVRPAPARWRGRVAAKLEGAGEAADRKAAHLLEEFLQGLQVVRGPGQVLYLCLLSIVHWGFAVLINYFVALCFDGFAMDMAGAALVFAFTALAVALPSAPGFVGVFHVAAAEACRALDLAAAESVVEAYAMVLWVVVNVPVIAVGLACLAYEGLTFGELRRQGERAKAEAEAVE